jgi:Bax protein
VLENERLLAIRIELLELRNKLADELELSETEQERLNRLAGQYKVDSKSYSLEGTVKELLKRIDGLPKELVLMQAANESAWGSSRFARLGLNFFGQWCYTPGCGIIPRSRPKGKTYEVEAFMSVQESVMRYFRNINTNPAYQVLRDIRAQLRANHLPLDAKVLATGLVHYSQRGDMYVQEISKMIEHNQAYMAD